VRFVSDSSTIIAAGGKAKPLCCPTSASGNTHMSSFVSPDTLPGWIGKLAAP
jgi:hypothetical protein